MKCLKLNWGFRPSWMKQGQIINAKRETVRAKSTFKGFRKCYVPINGWYKWLKTDEGKKPYYFHSEYDTIYVKSIMKDNIVILLTKDATESISHIHKIMPLLNDEPIFTSWNLKQANIKINYYEVSREVNYVGSNNSKLINPIF